MAPTTIITQREKGPVDDEIKKEAPHRSWVMMELKHNQYIKIVQQNMKRDVLQGRARITLLDTIAIHRVPI